VDEEFAAKLGGDRSQRVVADLAPEASRFLIAELRSRKIPSGQFHGYAAIIVCLKRLIFIQITELDLLQDAAGKIIERIAHDREILRLDLVAIFEDENSRGAVIFFGRLRGMIRCRWRLAVNSGC
jgi:hypothetical protein